MPLTHKMDCADFRCVISQMGGWFTSIMMGTRRKKEVFALCLNQQMTFCKMMLEIRMPVSNLF